jgi:hypothetical protein
MSDKFRNNHDLKFYDDPEQEQQQDQNQDQDQDQTRPDQDRIKAANKIKARAVSQKTPT